MSKWEKKTLKGFVKKGGTLTSASMKNGDIPVVAGGLQYAGYHNTHNRNENCITISASGANAGAVRFHKTKIFATDCSTVFWKYDQLYLYYELSRRQNQIFQMQTGLAQPHIYPKNIEAIEINYPTDTTEQAKIAEVLSTVDEIIEKTTAIIEKYTAIKKGLMQDLLAQGDEVDFHIIAKQIKLKHRITENDICLNMDSIETGTGRILSAAEDNLTSDKTAFLKDDVLFGKLRPYLRKYLHCTFNGYCSSEIMVFRAKEAVRSQFLYYVVSSESFVNYNNMQTFGTRMPRTSWDIIKKYKMKLPKLEVQDEIIEKVSAIDSLIFTEQNYLNKLLNLKKGLMNDLLTNKMSVEKLLQEEAI